MTYGACSPGFTSLIYNNGKVICCKMLEFINIDTELLSFFFWDFISFANSVEKLADYNGSNKPFNICGKAGRNFQEDDALIVNEGRKINCCFSLPNNIPHIQMAKQCVYPRKGRTD